VSPHIATGLIESLRIHLGHSGLIEEIIAGIVLVLFSSGWTYRTQRRRITWRDPLDLQLSPFPEEAEQIMAPPIDWKVTNHRRPLASPSLALLRVRNGGFERVGTEDFDLPLTFSFPGRKVEHFKVTGCHGVTEAEIRASKRGQQLALEPFSLNHSDRFALLVLLSAACAGQLPGAATSNGGARQNTRGSRRWAKRREGRSLAPADRVSCQGHIKKGRIDYEPPRRGPGPRQLAPVLVAVTVLAAVTLLQLGFALGNSRKTLAAAASCFSGPLLIEGSTAFAPTAAQIKRAYLGLCTAAQISIHSNGTYNGLIDLSNRGGQPGIAATTITMSDGIVQADEFPALHSTPVGAIVFSIVVSNAAGVSNLTLSQVRGIYQGKYTSWHQVGGANLPIIIVERQNSGTQRTFDTKILSPVPEPAPSSDNCRTKDRIPTAKTISCLATDTTAVLEDVNAIPGAIGYAQTAQVSGIYPYLRSVSFDGIAPGMAAVESGHYPFWAVEALYTYGNPASGTPAAAFRDYVTGPAATDVARSQGYTPCADLAASMKATACGQGDPGRALMTS